MPAPQSANELSITRVFDAPVKTVWEAWTDPAQVAQWWGPRGFTLTTHEKDLRPGGHWRYTMHGPDGVDYPNTTHYFEVVPMEKLVYDHGGSDDKPAMFRVTVLFRQVGDKTRMDMTMAFRSPEALADGRAIIKQAGGNSTWDRLAEHVAERHEGVQRFVIVRSFEAPIEMLFDLWTDPKHFSRWLPPTGMTMGFSRADIRVGGDAFYSMTDGKSLTMYGSVHYLEISRPDRLVYTQQFRNADGTISRHPLAPTWPETMLTTVTFDREGPDRTRVRVVWEPFGEATPEEVRFFLQARGGMTQGWTGSFDKLDSLVQSR